MALINETDAPSELLTISLAPIVLQIESEIVVEIDAKPTLNGSIFQRAWTPDFRRWRVLATTSKAAKTIVHSCAPNKNAMTIRVSEKLRVSPMWERVMFSLGARRTAIERTRMSLQSIG
jgi:hypothetical protein